MTNYEKILKRLERKLVSLIRRMLDQGYSQAEISNAAMNLIKDYNPYSKLRQQFQSDADKVLDKALAKAQKQFFWIERHTKDTVDEKSVNIFTVANSEFAKLQGEIESKIVQAVSRGITEDVGFSKLTDMIESAANGGRYSAKNIANTSLQGYSRYSKNTFAVESGIEEFSYFGPPPEREFCKQHYDKTYTLTEINAMSNGQGLSVFYFCGGYNCPHDWEPVIIPAQVELYKQRAAERAA